MQISNFLLTESWVGKVTQKISAPIISELLLAISVLLLWYEGLFARIGLGAVHNYMVVPILIVIALLLADKSKIRITRSMTYLISFFVFALISGVLAAGRGINPRLILEGWLLFAQFLIVILASKGVAKPERLIRNIMYISLPMMAVGGYQFVMRQATSPLWVTPAEASIRTRAFAFFGSPNVLGAVLAIVSLVAASLYFRNKDKFMLVASLLSAVVLGFTFSRSAWLGFFAGIAVIMLVKNWRLIAFAPISAVALLSRQVRDRVVSVLTPGYWLDSSLDGRLWSLNNGFHIWSQHPLLGTGTGTYGGQLALAFASPVYLEGIQHGYVALYFTDDQWLQLLVQTGVVGLTLFFLFATNALAELAGKYKSGGDWMALGVFGALTAFLVAGIFGNVLEFGAIAIPMGIMLGAVHGE